MEAEPPGNAIRWSGLLKNPQGGSGYVWFLPKNRGPDALGFEGRKDGRPVNLGALIFQEHLFAGIGNLHILCIAAILRLRFCAKEVVLSFLRTGFSSNRWCETASIQPWPLFAWHVFDVRFLPALEALK